MVNAGLFNPHFERYLSGCIAVPFTRFGLRSNEEMDRNTQLVVVLDQLSMVALLRRSVLALPLKLIR